MLARGREDSPDGGHVKETLRGIERLGALPQALLSRLLRRCVPLGGGIAQRRRNQGAENKQDGKVARHSPMITAGGVTIATF